jgi:hypothetical protein
VGSREISNLKFPIQNSKSKIQKARGEIQRAKGKGQRAKGKGQRAKGKGQRAFLLAEHLRFWDDSPASFVATSPVIFEKVIDTPRPPAAANRPLPTAFC